MFQFTYNIAKIKRQGTRIIAINAEINFWI